MIIELSRLKEGGERLQGEIPSAILELEPESGIEALTPIRYDLLVELTPGELVVRGTLSLRIASECNRCAKKIELAIQVPHFVCVREFRELTEAIDLTPDIREDTILAFPNYPVCSPECRGLCPRCGANLNETTCSCRPPEANRTWDALDQLKKRME